MPLLSKNSFGDLLGATFGEIGQHFIPTSGHTEGEQTSDKKLLVAIGLNKQTCIRDLSVRRRTPYRDGFADSISYVDPMCIVAYYCKQKIDR